MWLHGSATATEVVEHVSADDEPHTAVDRSATGTSETSMNETGASPMSLEKAMLQLRARGATGARCVLPVPGDLYGLAGPPQFNAAATEAAEAVLIDGVMLGIDGAGVGMVPRITTFGPPGDQGHLVEWDLMPAVTGRPVQSVAEADRELRAALVRSSTALAELDVARWHPEVADVLTDIRTARAAAPLPHGFSGPAQALAAQALRLLAVLDVALSDDGGALDLTEADQRRSALSELATTARHALVAASSGLE